MAPVDISSALQDSLYTGADTPYGIAASGVSNSLPFLVNPYGSVGSNALNVFGGSILAALLGRMAKSDAAEENAKIVAQQADFMNADPQQRLAMVKENPAVFAKLQAALGVNELTQQAQDKALTRQMELQKPFEIEKEKRAIENQIAMQTDPRLTGLKTSKDSEKAFDDELALAKTFATHADVTDYKYKEKTLKALTEAYKDKEGTSDFEMLRRVTQMVEPGLAVRADDQESLQQAASALGVSKALVDSIVSGNSKNDPQVRAGMMRIAQRAIDSSYGDYNTTREAFLKRSANRGLDPSLIVPYGEGKSFAAQYPDLAKQITVSPEIPPGMKLQRNKVTGETRLVPQ